MSLLDDRVISSGGVPLPREHSVTFLGARSPAVLLARGFSQVDGPVRSER
jgi:hypothetical protein